MRLVIVTCLRFYAFSFHAAIRKNTDLACNESHLSTEKCPSLTDGLFVPPTAFTGEVEREREFNGGEICLMACVRSFIKLRLLTLSANLESLRGRATVYHTLY